MPMLIDGYNLLNATGIVGRGVGPGGLAAEPAGAVELSGGVDRSERIAAHDRRVRRP